MPKRSERNPASSYSIERYLQDHPYSYYSQEEPGGDFSIASRVSGDQDTEIQQSISNEATIRVKETYSERRAMNADDLEEQKDEAIWNEKEEHPRQGKLSKQIMHSLNPDVGNNVFIPTHRLRMRIKAGRSFQMLETTEESLIQQPTACPNVDATTTPTLMALVTYIVLLFAVRPAMFLQLLLTVLMCFGSFPPRTPWWTAILAPMNLRARLEVTIYFALPAWVWALGWTEAYSRVRKWVLEVAFE